MRASLRILAGFPVFLAGASVSYALAVRPRLLRWGATDEELARPYPGAGIIPNGTRAATMAVTIEAPPAQVWPWLVQMGYDLAGTPGTASTTGAVPALTASIPNGRRSSPGTG